MFNKLITFCAVTILACLAWASAAHAGAYRISPLGLTFTPSSGGSRTLSLDLINVGKEPIVLQISAVVWQQVDGVDKYTPTKDLFFAPPIVTVQPLQKKTIPVRIRVPADVNLEKTYRVFIEEQASPNNIRTNAGMDFRARFGLPIFIKAARSSKQLPEYIATQESDRVITLRVKNTSGAHVRVNKIELYPRIYTKEEQFNNPVAVADRSVQGSAYVLNNNEAIWRLEAKEPFSLEEHRIWIHTDLETPPPVDGTGEGTFFVPFVPINTPNANVESPREPQSSAVLGSEASSSVAPISAADGQQDRVPSTSDTASAPAPSGEEVNKVKENN